MEHELNSTYTLRYHRALFFEGNKDTRFALGSLHYILSMGNKAGIRSAYKAVHLAFIEKPDL